MGRVRPPVVKVARALSVARLRDRWSIRPPLRRLSAAATTNVASAELGRLRDRMQACLDGRGGEVTARARAGELGRAYLELTPHGRKRFLEVLATTFDVDHEAAAEAARRLVEARDDDARAEIERELRSLLVPARVRLLRQFNALPDGTKFLVDLRADLLCFARDDETLRPLELDLKGLLTSWFDVGFLELRRITWDSPASLLEKLARSEAVHTVRGWDDLKDRLDTDRRLFAFFHPQMPDEPVIFVEVALVRGLPSDVASLLDPNAPVADPQRADTAAFYSISNTQPGLAGISFGGFLIKHVVDELSVEFGRMRTFATLSPIPGFRAWLDPVLERGRGRLLLAPERDALEAATGVDADERVLADVLASTDWPDRPAVAAALREPLLRLCAEYLLGAKRSDGRCLDPVANFHLTNGARVERLNWLADRSPNGLHQSAGLMVNYVYALRHMESNHESYTADGQIAASPAVLRLPSEGAG